MLQSRIVCFGVLIRKSLAVGPPEMALKNVGMLIRLISHRITPIRPTLTF